MPDFHIQQTVTDNAPVAVTLDWLQTPNGLIDETQALASAVIVALGTDRMAAPDDELPNPDSDDRRGWWGDFEAAEIHDGWPIGSRLWLLERAKITGSGAREGSTVARAEGYVREAIQPFIDKKIASRATVVAERVGIERIDVSVTLYRGPEKLIDLRFADLWRPPAPPMDTLPASGIVEENDDTWAAWATGA